MDDASFAKRVGTTLRGKWTLEKLLGVGGMAAVYSAAHKIGRRDAIKILHPEIAASAELRARFEQEAHAVNRFRHPGAVEIRDIDVSEDGAPFLVMELLEGETVSERARRDGGVPLDEALRLADELLDVLAAAHAEGIVHRDIKPDNLFLLHDGRLKVLDFGIARMRIGAPGQNVTRTGTALGTASYMPPEQVKGLDVDGRADLFAAGATLFRLLARRRIHEADSEIELMMRMASEAAPPLATIAPALPSGVCDVVDRALAYDRERRYPDARTMQSDVRALRRGEMPPFASARLAAGDRPNVLPAATTSSRPLRANASEPTRVEAASTEGAAPLSTRTGGATLGLVEGSSMTSSPASTTAVRARGDRNLTIALAVGVVVLVALTAIVALFVFRTRPEDAFVSGGVGAPETAHAKKKPAPGAPPAATTADPVPPATTADPPPAAPPTQATPPVAPPSKGHGRGKN